MTHPIKIYGKVTRRVSQYFRNHPRADMSKPPRDLPPFTKVLDNFRKAVIRDIKNGRKRVTLDVYLKRIQDCDNCVFREGRKCTQPNCGCILPRKCWWANERCASPDAPRWVEWLESGV